MLTALTFTAALTLSLCDTQPGEMVKLERIIDGDTIKVIRENGTREGVRYIGMDTAETDRLCGSRGTRVHRELLRERHLKLVVDPDVGNMRQDNRDHHHRLLRYVCAGSVLVNAELIRLGVALAVPYEPDIDLNPDFARLQADAEAAMRGCH